MMKRPISKLLCWVLVATLATPAYAQTAPDQQKRLVVMQESLQISLSEHIGPAISAAVTSLERLENLAVRSSSEKLASLQDLSLGASLSSLQVLGPDHDLPDPVDPLDPGVPTCGQPTPELQGAFAHTKVKKVERAFKVSRADKLSLENQFGRVEVQTWAKNEIAVEVTVIARAASETKAQEILDRINIKVNHDGNLISFVTEREPMKIMSSSEKGFEINYLVRMPKSNPLSVSNKHGAVQLPDFDGPTDFDLQYGKLTTGSLNNPKNNVAVMYSGAECQLGYVKGGTLTFKYSNLRLLGADNITTAIAYSNANIGKVDVLQLDSRYSNVTIDKVETLKMESRYDSKFHVGSAGQIAGNGSYSGIKIGSLRESANLNVKYCSGFEISNVATGFSQLNLTGGYTGMAVGFAVNSAFNFEVDTQYGSFKMDQDLANFSFREVRNTSSSYKGKYGKTAPKGTVNVTSRYGSVAFN